MDRIGGVEDPLVHRLSPLAVVGEVHQRRRSQGQRHPPQHVGQTQVALEHLPNTLKAVVVENPCCQYAGLGPPALGQIEQEHQQHAPCAVAGAVQAGIKEGQQRRASRQDIRQDARLLSFAGPLLQHTAGPEQERVVGQGRQM